MHYTHEKLFALFDQLDIDYKNYEHDPVFTVEEAQEACHMITGAHCKTLLLKDQNKQYYLISMRDDQSLSTNELRKQYKLKRLSFATAEELDELLGVIPGSVTPFALVNHTGSQVTFLLDHDLMVYEQVNFHPLRNDMTTSISPEGLIRLIEYLGHDMEICHLPKKT